MIRAKQEGRPPEEVSDCYHAEFCEVFGKLGLSFALYTKTTDPYHIDFVRGFHRELYKNPFVSEKTGKQASCPVCEKVLVDRMIVGRRPAQRPRSSAGRGDLHQSKWGHMGKGYRGSIQSRLNSILFHCQRPGEADIDFSRREFIWRNNSELLGAWWNPADWAVELLRHTVQLYSGDGESGDSFCTLSSRFIGSGSRMAVQADWRPDTAFLFERLDTELAEEERSRLHMT